MKNMIKALVIFSFCSAAIAAPVKKPAPAPPKKKPTTVVITPASLRQHLMNGDLSIAEGLNQVAEAKQETNIARANLLPSLDIGGLLSGASFSLSSVTILLPFLLPSNWFNLTVADEDLSATGYAFYISELNEFANAYELYQNYYNDSQALEAYTKIAKNYAQIQAYIDVAVHVGTATPTDLLQAKANTENSVGQVHNAQEALDQDLATIREMMGLSADVIIQINPHSMPANPAEKLTVDQIQKQTWYKAPERDQILSLIAAAQAQKLSTTWSFLGGASLGVVSGGLSSSKGGGPVGSGSIILSPSLFPQITMSQLDINSLEIQSSLLKLKDTEIIENALGSIQEGAGRVDEFTQAENDADQAFTQVLASFSSSHSIDYNTLNLSANSVQTATLNRVQAQMDLDNQRIALNRILITDEFKYIKPCVLKNGAEPDPISGFFGSIFGGADHTQQSVDQLCKN